MSKLHAAWSGRGCHLHDGTRGTCSTSTTGTSITLSKGNLGISMVRETMGNCLCATTGKMTTCGTRTNCITGISITLITDWEISMVRRTVWTMGTSQSTTTGMKMTLMSCLGTVLLVHTGYDAGHLGLPSSEGNTARSTNTNQNQPCICHCRSRR